MNRACFVEARAEHGHCAEASRGNSRQQTIAVTIPKVRLIRLGAELVQLAFDGTFVPSEADLPTQQRRLDAEVSGVDLADQRACSWTASDRSDGPGW
jgi:hypothetical protein